MFIKKYITFLLILTLVIEPALLVSTILKTDKYNKKISRIGVNVLSNVVNNTWNMLASKAEQNNGLTKKDKNLLASLIIDWADKKIKEKERNTVYWYTRQGWLVVIDKYLEDVAKVLYISIRI